ncbi:MAG: S41 family peptidase, partial [Mucilaginibacter sp.]
STTGTALQLTEDSVYLYGAEDYLWYNQLPTYAAFNPRSYTGADDMTALTKELDAQSQFAINPATGAPYEYYAPSPGQAKYSFIDDGSVSAQLNGVKGDFGFAPLYNDINDLRVKYVYPGSPAAAAGMRRGDQITSINGRTNISYDAGQYGSGTSANLNFVINAYSNSNTITMTLTRTNGSTYTVTGMNVSNYTVNPVLKDTVYDTGNGHKVGYIVFNSFTSDANADPVLDAAFNYFTTQGITDLVVDLRYNGGGYVSTAEYLDNLIVPAAKSGSVMYTTYYNDKLQNDVHPLLGKVYNLNPGDFKPANNQSVFAKKGSLNVNRVFFIMTGSTASASELTINNLRPEMDVQFIGNTSYGKPVGFFPIPIGKYQLYTPEFSTQNSAGQGGYYAGFSPGTTSYPGVSDYDDPTKDFGNPSETLLAHVLNYVKNGTYTIQGPIIQSTKLSTFSVQASNAAAIKLEPHNFNGMVSNKKLKLRR